MTKNPLICVLTMLWVLLPSTVACSGGNKRHPGAIPGQSEVTDIDNSGVAVDDAAVAVIPATVDGEPAPVTFVLRNSADQDLVLPMDKGYQPILFAYSGKPPNAKPILMFSTHCTASCDSPAEEICPICTEPDKLDEIRAAEKRVVIPPGQVHAVPWDGQIYLESKTKGIGENGRSTRCKCWRKQEVPPETYTIKSCALRLTQSAETRSKYQCVDGAMTLPAEGPLTIDLDFAAPE